MRPKAGLRDLLPAPGDLRLVQAFFNTVDREAGDDQLSSPQALGEWLARYALLAPGTEVAPADHARMLALREAWRALLGGSEKPGVAETFDHATAAAALRARPDAGGAIRLEPTAAGIDGAVGRLLVIAVEARLDDGWRLLKVCASPTCRAVFYDFSTNHTGKWCRPRCGNRMSSRLSKRRRRRIHAERAAALGPVVWGNPDRSKVDLKQPNQVTKDLPAKLDGAGD